jgi:hypothetical protein
MEEKTGQAGSHTGEGCLAGLKGMVPKPEKKLSLEEMDEAIGEGDRY